MDWTGVVWITCGLLWCFYQLFGLSFWRHPFTAEHPLMSKWCNATFLQIWWRNKLISDGLRVSSESSRLNHERNMHRSSSIYKWNRFLCEDNKGLTSLFILLFFLLEKTLLLIIDLWNLNDRCVYCIRQLFTSPDVKTQDYLILHCDIHILKQYSYYF